MPFLWLFQGCRVIVNLNSAQFLGDFGSFMTMVRAVSLLRCCLPLVDMARFFIQDNTPVLSCKVTGPS